MQAIIESEKRIRLRLNLLAGALCVAGVALAAAIVIYHVFTWGRWMGAALTVLLFAKAAFETVAMSPGLGLEAHMTRLEQARSGLDPALDQADYACLSAEIELTREAIASLAQFLADRERERRLTQ